jgi:hypothetical protein
MASCVQELGSGLCGELSTFPPCIAHNASDGGGTFPVNRTARREGDKERVVEHHWLKEKLTEA